MGISVNIMEICHKKYDSWCDIPLKSQFRGGQLDSDSIAFFGGNMYLSQIPCYPQKVNP